MFFLFGWGHRTTNEQGPTLPVKCPNCNNDTWYHLLSYRTWFTLFFIPIFPYESKNLLLCPICSSGIELSGEMVEKARRLNQAALQLNNNEIDGDEYTRIAAEVKLLT